jgi:hypothetical protein
MTDKFDPTTNRIAFQLLTDEERGVLKSWPHGIEYYSFGQWVSCSAPPLWSSDVAYRGKPAPVVTSRWMNVYPNSHVYKYNSRVAADSRASSHRIAVLRIDTCNGVSTAHLEEL